MAGKEFARGYVNSLKMREALREYSLIDSVESLRDCLTDLVLQSVRAEEDSVIASYRCIGSEDIYPHVRSRLIEKGSIKKRNVKSCEKKNSGQPNEYEHLHLIDEGATVQVHLNVFNPHVLGD